MASFSGEFLKRQVVDNNGDLFGRLEDMVIDTKSGELVEFLVEVSEEIDVSKLPWPVTDGLCRVPASEVSQMGSRIHLRR
ncbi:MAG: PRC-barrel domain-containing protein [Candidatus Poseidoniaceae archaeon]|jgi:sporulation protein YlmC with PRC-barrel domain|nr:PRC-barrel domain-containing protein [Candidatus Poseidoniaceae archaeon]